MCLVVLASESGLGKSMKIPVEDATLRVTFAAAANQKKNEHAEAAPGNNQANSLNVESA